MTETKYNSERELPYHCPDKTNKNSSFPIIQTPTLTKITNEEKPQMEKASNNESIGFLSTRDDLNSSNSMQGLSTGSLSTPSEAQKEAFIVKCCDKKNSKAIQTWLDTTSEEQTNFAFQMIAAELLPLCKHVFGNYVVQKFIEKGTKLVRSRLLQFLKGKVLTLSTNPYACRVIQAFLDSANKDNNSIGQHFIVSELKDSTLELIYDHSGNHVVQKLVDVCTYKVLVPVIEQVNIHVEKLAFHSFGSRVIQKILDRHFESPEKVKVDGIIAFAMEKTLSLSKCQNGNYIIQHLLEKGSDFEKVGILNMLKDHFLELSMDKFASNVTQKSLLLPVPSYQNLIIDSLITHQAEDPFNEPIVTLMTSTYGNYVVQSLYKNGNSYLKTQLINFIVQNHETMEKIRKSSFGKHVMSFVDKVLMSSSKEHV